MIITQQMMNNKLTLMLSGRFTCQDRKLFQEAICQATATNPRDIILNFAQVPFIDSDAVGMLAWAKQSFQLTQQQLILVAPQEYVSLLPSWAVRIRFRFVPAQGGAQQISTASSNSTLSVVRGVLGALSPHRPRSCPILRYRLY